MPVLGVARIPRQHPPLWRRIDPHLDGRPAPFGGAVETNRLAESGHVRRVVRRYPIVGQRERQCPLVWGPAVRRDIPGISRLSTRNEIRLPLASIPTARESSPNRRAEMAIARPSSPRRRYERLASARLQLQSTRCLVRSGRGHPSPGWHPRSKLPCSGSPTRTGTVDSASVPCRRWHSWARSRPQGQTRSSPRP